jgi:hypothetical protein
VDNRGPLIDDCPSAPWPGDPAQYRRQLVETATAVKAGQAKATQARFLGAEAAAHPPQMPVTPALLRAVTWRLCFERTLMLLEVIR